MTNTRWRAKRGEWLPESLGELRRRQAEATLPPSVLLGVVLPVARYEGLSLPERRLLVLTRGTLLRGELFSPKGKVSCFFFTYLSSL